MNVNSDQFFHLTPTTTFETRLPWVQDTESEASTKGILRTRHPDLPEHSALVGVSRRQSSPTRGWSEDMFSFDDMLSFDALAEVPEEDLGVPVGFHVPYWNLRVDRSADPRDFGDPTKSDFHLTHQRLEPEVVEVNDPRIRGADPRDWSDSDWTLFGHARSGRSPSSATEFTNRPMTDERNPSPTVPWLRRVSRGSLAGGPQFEDTLRRIQYVPRTGERDAGILNEMFPHVWPGGVDIDATLVSTHKGFLEDIQAVGEYFPRRGVDE